MRELARYLGEYSPDPDADDGADPCAVTKAHVEAFQAWMIETRSASTALNKFKCLQTGDLMMLLGWASEDMPRRYGASAAAERAMDTLRRIGIGEGV